MTNTLVRNGQLVRHTEVALRTGNESLGNVPALLRTLLEEQAWRDFALPSGEEVKHARFGDFVTANPPRGLGADLTLVERIVGTNDPDLLRMLKAAKKGQQGRRTDLSPPGESPVGAEPWGQASAVTADRLARDAPEQYEQVRAGQRSINAAAVEAGIRPRRVSIRVDDASSAARTLRTHMTSETLVELAEMLKEDKR